MNPTLGLVLLLAAPAIKEAPKKHINVAGEWQVERLVVNGRPIDSTADRKYIFSADGKWTRTEGEETPKLLRTFTIDSSKNPIAIDMKLSDPAKAAAHIGIVKIEGDTMTLCYSRNQAERPTKFESPEGSTVVLIVMKRKKKE